MKKAFPAILVSLILALAVTTSSLAALPGSGWWTAYRVQNISDSTGTLTMQAYDQSTTAPVGSNSFDFDHGRTLAYDPGQTPDYPTGNLIGFSSSLPAGFVGSVVLSSSVPAASVVELANFTNGSLGGGGTASGSYQGFSGDMVATTLSTAAVKHNYTGTTTTLYVQAAGADATVTITYKMATESATPTTHTQTVEIAANRMYIFDPANATPPVPNTDCGNVTGISPCFGSAIIQSTAPIAGVLAEHPHVGAPAEFVQVIRLSTPTDQSTKLYAPAIKNDFLTSSGNQVCGIEIMNMGTAPAYVRVTSTVTQLGSNADPAIAHVGDIYTYEDVIDPGLSINFSKWNNNLGGLPTGTMASVVVESLDETVELVDYDPQPLIGGSNDAKTQAGFPGGGRARVKYNLFSDLTVTSKAAAPYVKEWLGIQTGGLQAQNVGTTADTIYFEFYEFGSTNVYTFYTATPVASGAAVNTNWISQAASVQVGFTKVGTWNWADLAGKEFSVLIYTEGGQNIAVMVNENTPPLLGGNLDISRYECINY